MHALTTICEAGENVEHVIRRLRILTDHTTVIPPSLFAPEGGASTRSDAAAALKTPLT